MSCNKICADYLGLDGYIIPMEQKPQDAKQDRMDRGVNIPRGKANMKPYIGIGLYAVLVVGVLGAMAYK